MFWPWHICWGGVLKYGFYHQTWWFNQWSEGIMTTILFFQMAFCGKSNGKSADTPLGFGVHDFATKPHMCCPKNAWAPVTLDSPPTSENRIHFQGLQDSGATQILAKAYGFQHSCFQPDLLGRSFIFLGQFHPVSIAILLSLPEGSSLVDQHSVGWWSQWRLRWAAGPLWQYLHILGILPLGFREGHNGTSGEFCTPKPAFGDDL